MGICGVVFPGQGSQCTGMGEDFFKSFPESQTIYRRASEALQFDMPTLCFSNNELLNQTEFTQPAILTTEIAILEALRARFNFSPSFFAGHSLGEYTGLVAAGALQFEDALRIVKRRGSLMQSAVPPGKGAMAALILDNISTLNLTRALKEYDVDVANYNSRDQIVISGLSDGMASACQYLAKEFPTMRIVPLNVSAPFHSRQMNSIQRDFEKCLRLYWHKIDRDKVVRVMSNFRGGFHSARTLIRDLVKQIAAPVRWMENMQTMTTRASEIYEVGPQRVLAKFFSSLGINVKAITDTRSLERAFGSANAYAV